ncbi:phosphoadenosine phosphosulfate reductase family protein [Oceanibaculum nanhaiense]|uniref:phosphoadenosine phosphosulfate reductase domain-containing protein n=1 Tax=Oceanibaculum nanhaiense TaxID=1909734 RepID=UPI003D26645C
MKALATIATDTVVDAMIVANAPVAIGVSGGKDSQAAALATVQHLDRIGHTGPRLLVHSDLGEVEWRDSLPTCERLAQHLNIELLVVRRAAGDMMDRWEARWASSVRRYEELSTVTLVPCWSTPKMRFCTSELKTQVIRPALRRRFPGANIINVTGVRRAESAARSRKPVFDLDVSAGFLNWRPLSDWSDEDVFGFVARCGLAVHEAYTAFRMSRVSCRFCIMSNLADLHAAAAAPEAADIYRRMVDLEIASAFAFQGARWLGDIAPVLLSPAQRDGLARAKRTAVERSTIEAAVTPGMRYVKGWPLRMLTDKEAETLAQVRRSMSALYGFTAEHLDVASIHGRYAELLSMKQERAA